MDKKETKQLETWKGEFGRSYTDRNMMTPEQADQLCLKDCGTLRTDLYKESFRGIEMNSILEVGCNIANQLMLLQKMGYKDLWGIEPQEYASELAKKRTEKINIVRASAFDIPFKDNYFDLVFTSGVLEHIAPEDLPNAMEEIYRCSKKYIFGFETYVKEGVLMVDYRKNKDLLWRANYSKLFLERFPKLKLVKEKVFEYKPTGEFDSVYLLEK